MEHNRKKLVKCSSCSFPYNENGERSRTRVVSIHFHLMDKSSLASLSTEEIKSYGFETSKLWHLCELSHFCS